MNKIIVKSKYRESIAEHDRFIDAIQLGRIVGAIRCNNVLQVEHAGDDEASLSRRVYLLLNHAALLYEGIRTFISAKKAFKELPYYKKNEDKIRVLSSEFGDARSFSNRVLKKIRDKIAFHFDKDLITLILRDYLADSSRSNSDIVLVTGKSELVKDMAFPFADKLIITHVLRSIEGEGQSDEEKFRILAERLLNLSNIFCMLIDDLIPDLVGEYCELRKDEDQT